MQGRTENIKKLGEDNNGLGQWALNVEEISKLYRHSRIPNEHPQYIPVDSIPSRVEKVFPEIKGLLEEPYAKEVVSEKVQIRDGVHYYETSYYIKDEIVYSIWIDAITGSLRQFEDYRRDEDAKVVSKKEALEIAKNFIHRFDSYDKVIEGASSIVDESTGDTIYAFQFTPIADNIAMISDAVKVRVSSSGGRIIRYANDFNKTQIPRTETVVSLEEIKEKYSGQLVNMQYSGMAVVRSFYTHYRPVVTYNYVTVESEETRKLYFDVVTGNQVYEAYSVYEPVDYLIDGENY